MELTGSHTINASAPQIWAMLMNPDTLAKVTPGISKLELEREGLYKAIADIKMGPVSGRFEGFAEVLEPVINESFVLKIVQNSKIGNVDANVRMMLKPVSSSQTELSFEGVADMSGLLARTGQRVMAGVANTLTKQFFSNFETELATIPQVDSEKVVPAIERVTVEIGFFQKIINWLKSLFQ